MSSWSERRLKKSTPVVSGSGGGQYEQLVREAAQMLDLVLQRLEHAPVLLLAPASVERAVDLAPHERERGPELVRRVGRERAHAREAGLETRKHGVERVDELAQLVMRDLHVHAPVQIVLADRSGHARDRADGPQGPPCQPV